MDVARVGVPLSGQHQFSDNVKNYGTSLKKLYESVHYHFETLVSNL